jgi:hypothetical protein
MPLTRFYLLAAGLDAILVANVKNATPAGSPDRRIWFIAAGTVALAYAGGFAVERRRLDGET